jgi:hypothetical protein
MWTSGRPLTAGSAEEENDKIETAAALQLTLDIKSNLGKVRRFVKREITLQAGAVHSSTFRLCTCLSRTCLSVEPNLLRQC